MFRLTKNFSLKILIEPALQILVRINLKKKQNRYIEFFIFFKFGLKVVSLKRIVKELLKINPI